MLKTKLRKRERERHAKKKLKKIRLPHQKPPSTLTAHYSNESIVFFLLEFFRLPYRIAVTDWEARAHTHTVY